MRKVVFYLFIIIVLFFSVYKTVKLFTDNEYYEDQMQRIESGINLEKGNYSKVFKYSKYTLLAFTILCLVVIVIFSRWRNIRIFISYNIENELIAQELKQSLERFPIKVNYIPFEKNADHDIVIRKITNLINWSSERYYKLECFLKYSDCAVHCFQSFGKP